MSLLTGDWASEIPSFQQDYTPASGFFFFGSLGSQDMHMCQATGRKLFPSAQQTGGGRQKGTVVVSTTHGRRGGSGYVDRLAKSQEKGMRHRWWITDKSLDGKAWDTASSRTQPWASHSHIPTKQRIRNQSEPLVQTRHSARHP